MQRFLDDMFKLPIRIGSVIQQQAEFMMQFLREHPEIKYILETGFHTGLSAALMMSVRPEIEVTSFDIFWFDYTSKAKLLLDRSFPDRHILIAGNSATTLKTFFIRNPNYSPDFVFIDGGHDRPIPYIDTYVILSNCRAGAWVMIDDYCVEHGSGGVMEAVDLFVKEGVLEDVKGFKAADRGWVLGRRSSTPMPPCTMTETQRIALLEDVRNHYD
jgi:predicted O-methyltransferase YrrM